MPNHPTKSNRAPWREGLHQIIFEADTPAGKLFDLVLFWSILASVLAVVLESMQEIQTDFGDLLSAVEWGFTVLFSVEYGLRLISVRRPLKYMVSFFGLVDLVSIMPSYLALFAIGSHSLLVIRVLRLLRVFRVLKMRRYMQDADVLISALRESRRKILLFVDAVLLLVLIMGTLMYLVEGPENGFTSIPRGIYWAIVTVTTVGYGDISPHTGLGQAIASLMMLMGYGIIAVPTGIITAGIQQAAKNKPLTTQACPDCMGEGHDTDARFCKFCGGKL
ncbi:MAG: ion transporter [Deltaproteobacteria bacterium]|nr:ion transporter [Deltaproteobacteria bacterium]